MTPDAKAKAKAKEKPPSSESGLSPDQVLVLSVCRRGKQIPTDVNNQFTQQANKSDLLDDEEDFFDFISRYVKGISTIHVILQRVIHFSMSGSSRSEWTTKGALWQIQNPPLILPTEVTIVLSN